ncbi:MAG: hypothetical protein HEQ32_08260 [Vampirovibrio sp.]
MMIPLHLQHSRQPMTSKQTRQGNSTLSNEAPPIEVKPQWSDSKVVRLAGSTALWAGIGAVLGGLKHALFYERSTRFGSSVPQKEIQKAAKESLNSNLLVGTAVGLGLGVMWSLLRSFGMKSADALARERFEKEHRVELMPTADFQGYRAVPVLAEGLQSEGNFNTPHFIRQEPVQFYPNTGSNDLFQNMMLWHMMSQNSRYMPYETHHYHYGEGEAVGAFHGTNKGKNNPRVSTTFRQSYPKRASTSVTPPLRSTSGMKSSGRGWGTSQLAASGKQKSSGSLRSFRTNAFSSSGVKSLGHSRPSTSGMKSSGRGWGTSNLGASSMGQKSSGSFRSSSSAFGSSRSSSRSK